MGLNNLQNLFSCVPQTKESHKNDIIFILTLLKAITDHFSSPMYYKKIISNSIQYLSLYSSQLLEDALIAVMKICSSWFRLIAGSICHKLQYAEVYRPVGILLSIPYGTLRSQCSQLRCVRRLRSASNWYAAWLIQSHFVSNCHYSPKLWAGRQWE